MSQDSKEDTRLVAITRASNTPEAVRVAIAELGLYDHYSLREVITFLVAQAAAGVIESDTLREIRALLELAFTTLAFEEARQTQTPGSLLNEIAQAAKNRDKHKPAFTIEVEPQSVKTAKALGFSKAKG